MITCVTVGFGAIGVVTIAGWVFCEIAIALGPGNRTFGEGKPVDKIHRSKNPGKRGTRVEMEFK